jgi:hypothetical protein
MMSSLNVDHKLAVYREACRKGTAWLLRHMNPDGSIGPVEERLYYYRVPWAFALVGEITAASRVLDWIHQNMFTGEGAFEGVSPLGSFDYLYGSYPVACLIVGATLLRRFDIVYPGTRHLRTWQDADSGGFFNDRQNKTDSGEQEIFPTSQGGMTLLVAGQLDAAVKAGEWMKRLWQLQPDAAHQLYYVYSPAKGLVLDYSPEQQRHYVTLKNQPWQHHYNGGIAAAFLTKLHMATGDGEWLDLAREYQAFSMTSDPCQFQSMQVCKSGWGAGLLYTATREEAYRNWTARMGDWFVENQQSDGHWENTPYLLPEPTTADNIEITVEFVMHLANIIAYLSV